MKKPKIKAINESMFLGRKLLPKRTGNLFNENKQAFGFPIKNISLHFREIILRDKAKVWMARENLHIAINMP